MRHLTEKSLDIRIFFVSLGVLHPSNVQMEDQRPYTASFTGHRTYCGEADQMLCHTLRALYARGYRTFLSGMAVGFDLAAAEAVVALREELPEIRLHAVVPFAAHGERMKPHDRERYDRLLRAADRVTLMAEAYYPACYHRRNDFLVSEASYLIAWYDGSTTGGTYYTLQQARRAHLPIENLWPDPQLKIEL